MTDFKFNCPHCEQSLEAPDELLGQPIECPSCNGSIQLPAPPPQSGEARETTPPSPEHTSPAPKRKKRGSGERKASPKQRALLAYLGVENAEKMGAREGGRLLDEYCRAAEPFRLFQLLRLLKKERDLAWPWVRGRIRNRMRSWHTDRLVLHPRLYQSELFELLEQPLRSYVRSEVVGASEKLTANRVHEVILSLSDRDPRWWQAAPNTRNSNFFTLLREMYPGCCDGKKPSRKGNTAAAETPSSGSGCCVVLAALAVVIVVIVVMV